MRKIRRYSSAERKGRFCTHAASYPAPEVSQGEVSVAVQHISGTVQPPAAGVFTFGKGKCCYTVLYKLLEPLFNMIFKAVPENTLHRIRGQIRRDDQAGDANLVCQRIESATGISMTAFGWNVGMVMTAIGRLERTHGNSTLEKQSIS